MTPRLLDQRCTKIQRIQEAPGLSQLGDYLHEVTIKEGLQLPLGRRVREVSDIESATLCSAGQDSLIMGVLCGLILCRLGLGNGGVAKFGSNVVDGLSNFLHDARHDC